MSEELVNHLLHKMQASGIQHIALCPGSRNASFVQQLNSNLFSFQVRHWYEERSAAFYSLGKIKNTGQASAVITTSGTAAAELLPACMEAHYLNAPLLLITADRPRRFRGSGAPQCAEQIGLFSHYVRLQEDIARGENIKLFDCWKKNGPAHLNVCLEDPRGEIVVASTQMPCWKLYKEVEGLEALNTFLEKAKSLLVIVSGLAEKERPAVKRFLQRLQAPVILESTSGLREDNDLSFLAIRETDQVWIDAVSYQYPIEAVLRIGGTPTLRTWRDLDDKEGKVAVFSISSLPFPGLYWGESLQMPLENLDGIKVDRKSCRLDWQTGQKDRWQNKQYLFQKYPQAEPSLIHFLSKKIPSEALVYLGNSLPIREWDLAADYDTPHPNIAANRGVNGIDGQLSTFFGMCTADKLCWGIFGDLTSLYDLAGPWALLQDPTLCPVCVIVNNGGGQIFSRMYPQKAFLNSHALSFRPLADLWGMGYEKWERIPERLPKACYQRPLLIEIVPDCQQTRDFWQTK